jgi:hypothetical protein
LEQSWRVENAGLDSEMGAREDVIREAYEIMLEMEGWGGWPDDGEVVTYLERGRFPA